MSKRKSAFLEINVGRLFDMMAMARACGPLIVYVLILSFTVGAFHRPSRSVLRSQSRLTLSSQESQVTTHMGVSSSRSAGSRLAMSLKADWGFLDGIYLITTEGGDDRVTKTKEQLEKVGMWGNVQVRTYKTDDEDRVRGCYTSHMSVLSDVRKSMQGKDDYKVLILEDNLEVTERMSAQTVANVASFLNNGGVGHNNNGDRGGWDIFHLGYMMYVPGLSLKKVKVLKNSDKTTHEAGSTTTGGNINGNNVVQMFTDASSAVGTSAYVVSKRGVDRMIGNNEENGYVDAVPNVMSRLFPETRYAAYPMVFHRAGKTKSLVNPQLDDFRKIMFTSGVVTFWEKLMVRSGLQNNQLFPGLVVSLLFGVAATVVVTFNSGETDNGLAALNPALASAVAALPQVLISVPLLVAIWGATLFTPGVTDGGYAKGAAPTDLNKA